MTARTIKKPDPVSGEVNAAIAGERARISAIIESPEGKRNPELAAELALRSSLDPESAKGILGKSPAQNPYLQAMSLQGKVDIDATAVGMSDDPKAARLAEIAGSMKAFNASRGYKSKG